MKSKAPLVMMEQIVMVLVFALAAAVCLQAFVLSEKISTMTEVKNRAAVEVQNIAEAMKNDDTFSNRFFTEDWQIVQDENLAEYIVTVSYEKLSELPAWRAELVLTTAGGKELIRIPVAGQTEVVQ